MKQRILIITTVAVLGLVLVGFGIYYFLSKNSSSVTPTPTPTPTPVTFKQGKLTSVDDTWNLYTNTEWGFSIKLPTKVEGSNCFKTSQGYIVVNDGDPLPLTILETDKVIYAATSKTFVLASAEDCHSRQVKLEDMDIDEDSSETIINTHMDFRRAMNIATADLPKFIKEQYGSGCEYIQEPTSQTNVFDLVITAKDTSIESENCPIDFSYAIKYSSERKEVIFWELGQEGILLSPEGGVYDQLVTDSFRFL